jgi:hypothetical protein
LDGEGYVDGPEPWAGLAGPLLKLTVTECTGTVTLPTPTGAVRLCVLIVGIQ